MLERHDRHWRSDEPAGEETVSTKNNPGERDCYAKAAPDEPMFILLARDQTAPELVRQWAAIRCKINGDLENVTSAYECADAMERWRRDNPPEQKP